MTTITVVEPIRGAKPPDCEYEVMLRESINHFLLEHKRGCSDFSGFESIFFRLVQAMTDPPLEITWFYSAVTFRGSCKSMLGVVVAVKDLFQLLVSCSSQSDGLKRIAVLAPLVYELYYVVVDCLKRDRHLCLKKEMEGLIDGIVSYISMCCSNYEWRENGMEILTGSFVELVRVWTVDRVGKNCEFGDDLRMFFPLVSDEVVKGISVGSEVSYLAGIVMVEAFFLRLCLKFGLDTSREELQREMPNWAAQTMMGYQNCYYFDMLLRMLLEPTLPVTTLLSSVDEILLHKALYDVMIVAEYPFVKSQIWTQLPGNYLKNLVLTWLLVADIAIEFVREGCDHDRLIAYEDAFSKSCLPNQLIEWVINQIGMENVSSRPLVSTPKALIRWLLSLEGQGVRIFEHITLKIQANAALCKSNVLDHRNPNAVSSFYNESDERVENKVDDQEMVDSMDEAFIPTDCTATERRNKRKDGRTDEGETRVKLAKLACV
ncbi:hypothetical protein NMG60_11000788 [Bertholletia excelsa]